MVAVLVNLIRMAPHRFHCTTPTPTRHRGIVRHVLRLVLRDAHTQPAASPQSYEPPGTAELEQWMEQAARNSRTT